MKRATTLLVAMVLGVLVAHSAFAANSVRISMIYGGGGGGSGPYKYDFVELFNNSGAPINIGGWTLQYGSATGPAFANSAPVMPVPAGAVIPACGYYLMQISAANAAGADLPVTPDAIMSTTVDISQSNGKIALVNNNVNTAHTCSGNSVGGDLVDAVGWGTATCFEGAASAALGATLVDLRKGAGTQDTDSNSNDFTQPTAASTTIHNSQSAQNPGCLVVPANSNTWGSVKMLYR